VVMARSWNSHHGGVYVPVTVDNPPNPYLEVSHRDVLTEDGQALTLVNPAYMTRQIAEISAERYKTRTHITSLDPIRPANAPYDWEAEALRSFKRDSDEYHAWHTGTGDPVFRYMAPLWTETSCLSCHAKQGYQEGELRGGISISLPAIYMLSHRNHQIKMLVYGYLIVWLLGITGLWLSFRRLAREHLERSRVINRLEQALRDVRTLEGFIPICAWCKKIRDDEGYWNQIEEYIQRRSAASFSHGICPDCMEKQYGELDELEVDRSRESRVNGVADGGSDEFAGAFKKNDGGR
jgi:hypothetical protein